MFGDTALTSAHVTGEDVFARASGTAAAVAITTVLASALAAPVAGAAPTVSDPPGSVTVVDGRTDSTPGGASATGRTTVGVHVRSAHEQTLVRPDGTSQSLAVEDMVALHGCGPMAAGTDSDAVAVTWHDDITGESGKRAIGQGRTFVTASPSGWVESRTVSEVGTSRVELHEVDARTGADTLLADVMDPVDPSAGLSVSASCAADGWTVVARGSDRVLVYRLDGTSHQLVRLLTETVDHSVVSTFAVVGRAGSSLAYFRAVRDSTGTFNGTVYRKDGSAPEVPLLAARSVRAGFVTPDRTVVAVRQASGYAFYVVPLGEAPVVVPALGNATATYPLEGDELLAVVPSGTASGVYRMAGGTTNRVWQPPMSPIYAYEASLPPGRIAWSDNRSGVWTVHARSVTQASPLQLDQAVVSYGTSTYPDVQADGRRVAFQEKGSGGISVHDGTTLRRLGRSYWPIAMTGHRILDANPDGIPDRVFDLAAGAWRDYGVDLGPIWGPYGTTMVSGRIKRVDLGTGAITDWVGAETVGFPAGSSISAVALSSRLVVFSVPDPETPLNLVRLGWYDWHTRTHGTIVADVESYSVRAVGGLVSYTAHTSEGRVRTVFDTAKGGVALELPGSEDLRLGSGRAYWTDAVTGAARAAAVPGAQPSAPVHEGNPIAPGTRYRSDTAPWHGEWVFTEPLTDCAVTVSTASGASVVTRPCDPRYTTLGEAVVDWDGRDAAGALVPAGSYTWSVRAAGEGGPAVSATGGAAISGTIVVRSDTYTPVGPLRLVDTRSGLGAPRSPIGAGRDIAVQVGGRAGIPVDAAGVVLNVTAVAPAGAGFMTVFPSGTARSTASTLNYAGGQTIANQVLAKLGADGKVRLHSHATSHAVVDVVGYYPAGPNLTPLSPARLLDTRVTKLRVPAGGSVTVPVAGHGGVPVGAAAAVLNVTAVNPSAPGFLTVFPAGRPRPDASNVNVPKGGIVSGMTVVPLGSNGAVTIYSHSASDVVVDVSGWAPPTSDFRSLTPARLLDTRAGIGASKSVVGSGHVVGLVVAGRGGVPTSGLGAVLLNVTVTSPQGPGVVTAYASGTSRPTVSTLNFVRGQTISNTVLVRVGSDGRVNLHTTAGTQLIADVQGYVRR